MSARNRELATLLLAGLVASTAFASAWISGLATVDYGWLPWAALLGGIFLVAHVVARWTVPDADPTLPPRRSTPPPWVSRNCCASPPTTAKRN